MISMLIALTGDEVIVFVFFSILGIVILGLIAGTCASHLKGWLFRKQARRILGHRLDDVTLIQTEMLVIDLPNFHRAMEHWDEQPDSRLIRRLGIPERVLVFDAIREGKMAPQAIRYQMVQIAPRKRIRVPIAAIYFLRYRDQGFLVWNEPRHLMVAGADESLTQEVLEQVTRLSSQYSCYRGQVLSLSKAQDYDYGDVNLSLEFHEIDRINETDIILPSETMELLRRSTVDFFNISERLVEMGQSGSRGLLLHGPPGTGKTLVSRWLIGHLPDVTKFLLTGQQLIHLEQTVKIAKMLRPSLLILDDVDLIASHRETNPYGSVLHELMNQMDGLERQDQVMFLLTTNRPEQIESALVDRPGRVDQAIEFPLPDAHCRERLLQLFAGDQTLAHVDLSHWIRSSNDTTPAFLRELVRRASQFAIIRSDQSGEPSHLTDPDFQAAIRDMTTHGGALTKRLLGFGVA
ncbi:AAA family ATPase [Aporhodopirellula aestuarii]|uniref:AAA family ATPase n=1 Tax=Aporhodopirellula aestuarii TaxID=2950107 RepID=A0ABT0U8A5_9BACT|nr:AAA family ATPase [Aporhodopirellula aestuarii]MCM2372909.1 AAA family ATPase [Aporhodopirellula aestuarii]